MAAGAASESTIRMPWVGLWAVNQSSNEIEFLRESSSVANGTSRAVVHPLSRCMSLYAAPGRQASLSFW